MRDSRSFVSRLASELKRRKVPQVAAAYLAVAATAVGAATAAVPALYLPAQTSSVIVLASILGFPIVVVVAWVFDLTPQGVRRTEEAELDPGLSLGRPSRIALLAATVLVTSSAGVAFWVLHVERAGRAAMAPEERERPPLDPNHVVVLYLDDLSRNQDLGYLAEGLTQNLIHELSDVEGLQVVSLNGIKPFRDHHLPIDSVGRILGSGSVVGGSVQEAGDSLRVTVQLVDAATGDQLASTKVDAPSRSLFALQDSLTSEVARFLRRRLGKEVELRRARRGTHDPEAWRLYQVAIRLRDDADSLRLARDTAGAGELYGRVDSLLTVAARLDPKWSQPTLERGWTALSRARLRSVATSEADTVPLLDGIADANLILAMDAHSAAALELRGNLQWFLSQAMRPRGSEASQAALRASEQDLRAATTTDPGLARAWAVLAYILKNDGKFEEARVDARRMSEADPYLANDVVYLYMSAALALELGRTERADSLFARGEALYPRVPAYPSGRLVTLASRPTGPGAVHTAWALLHKTEELYGPWQKGRYCVAATLARAGLADSARAVARTARVLDPDSPTVPHEEAYLALLLGDRDQALRLLGRYLELMPHERAYVAKDWWWAPLHGDPRFQALIVRPTETRHRPVG